MSLLCIKESLKNKSVLGHFKTRIGVFLPELRFTIRVSSSKSEWVIVLLLVLFKTSFLKKLKNESLSELLQVLIISKSETAKLGLFFLEFKI
jgi:hypothetical protein